MLTVLSKIKARLLRLLNMSGGSKFAYLDKTSRLSQDALVYNPQNIYMYQNTNIDHGATIMNTRAKFIMKKNSGAAFGLTVITGNHLSVPGMWFKSIDDKIKNQIDINREADKDIVVEEDVWIGSRVTLLSGVVLGRGCEVGSGSVVRRNVPPYACVIGNPARIVGFKFTPEEIIEHEYALYPDSERIPIDILEKNYTKYYLNRIKEIKEYLKN